MSNFVDNFARRLQRPHQPPVSGLSDRVAKFGQDAGRQSPPVSGQPPVAPPDPFAAFTPDPNKTGASYIDSSGRQVHGSAKAPTGTPYYASAPLLNGGTRTAQGDASNPFRGYVGPQGGGFGGNVPMSPQELAYRKANYGGAALQATGAFGRFNKDAFAKRLTDQQAAWDNGGNDANDPMSVIQRKMDAHQPLTDDEAAYQAYSSGQVNAPGGWRASYDPTTKGYTATYNTNDGRVAGLNKDGSAIGGQSYYDTLLKNGEIDQARYTQLVSDAQRNATQSNAPQAPAVDSDPFGRFDNPAGPAQHGIITPAMEAQGFAQSNQIQQPPFTDPNAPQMTTPATGTPNGITRVPLPPLSGDPMVPPTGVTGISRLGPQDIPPQGGDPSVPITGITGIGPNAPGFQTPPSTAPVGGWPQLPQTPNGIGPNSPGFQTPPSSQPPVAPPAVDPFQAFNPANPIPPVTPNAPQAGARSPVALY